MNAWGLLILAVGVIVLYIVVSKGAAGGSGLIAAIKG